ncbi:transcriptional repressor [Candidatus Bipolaricaulota bacterium]|nr:transcriptional repressor [Candidatus Bipolaricaulota bacterium]
MDTEARSKRLRELGLVPTIQRVAVLEFLEKNHTHPTAEEVYCGVKARFPSIAKATVYNTLDVLKKAGTIRELTIAREAARYDYDPSSHPHFLCRVCGNLIDIDLPCPIRSGDEVLGHKVESVQTYLYGVCSQCRKNHDKDKNESKLETDRPSPTGNGRDDA